MGPEEFRRLARSLPEAVEKEHMQHPDFRVGGKNFATLGYPDEHWAMVKLSPQDQERLVRSHPNVFAPAKGAWGRQGSTGVRLKAATATVMREVLAAAWRNTAPKKLVKRLEGDS
jgi:hypothetical protein